MSPLLNQNWANIGAKHLQITDLTQQMAQHPWPSLVNCWGSPVQAITMSACLTLTNHSPEQNTCNQKADDLAFKGHFFQPVATVATLLGSHCCANGVRVPLLG
jgi:hypothetical protein